jgi:hypothetical protein
MVLRDHVGQVDRSVLSDQRPVPVVSRRLTAELEKPTFGAIMNKLSPVAVRRIATALATTSVVLGGSLIGAAATSPADATALPQISVAHDMVKAEGNRAKTMFLQFVRTGDVSKSSTVKVTITAGTATAGSDYTAVHDVTTLIWPAGRTFATVAVRILGDRVAESDDFTLSDAVDATIGDAAGSYTIVNDD